MMRKIGNQEVFGAAGLPLAVQLWRNPRSEPHTHEFTELVLILEGGCTHLTGGEAYELGAGDTFVIPSGRAHAYRQPRDLLLANILFDAAGLPLPLFDLHSLPGYHVLFGLEPRYRNRDRFRSRLHLTAAQLAEIRPLAEAMETELRHRQPGFAARSAGLLLEVVVACSRWASAGVAAPRADLVRIGEVISHVDCHYREPLTVPELARLGRVSESTLTRIFRQAVGATPLEYLLQRRLRRAEELLRLPGQDVKTVAALCGFRDANYFTRRFRAATGLPPREYRRRSLPSGGA
ncbi:MAG: helix-turn-helix domain-containing protein [Lentisphaeria bacterium]|jgi:AraC-like DNA-binding protein